MLYLSAESMDRSMKCNALEIFSCLILGDDFLPDALKFLICIDEMRGVVREITHNDECEKNFKST